MKLSELKEGQEAQVISVSGDPDFQERLCELGIASGARVGIKARLPFKGPIVMRVESTTLALRPEEAEFIEVKI